MPPGNFDHVVWYICTRFGNTFIHCRFCCLATEMKRLYKVFIKNAHTIYFYSSCILSRVTRNVKLKSGGDVLPSAPYLDHISWWSLPLWSCHIDRRRLLSDPCALLMLRLLSVPCIFIICHFRSRLHRLHTCPAFPVSTTVVRCSLSPSFLPFSNLFLLILCYKIHCRQHLASSTDRFNLSSAPYGQCQHRTLTISVSTILSFR